MSTSVNMNKIRYKRNKKIRPKGKERPDGPVERKWSNTKVHKELSSFIAEFSYLEDTPKSNDYILIQRPPHPEKTLKYKQNAIRVSKSPIQLKKQRKQRLRRNKSVEWRDITIELEPSCDDRRVVQSHEDVTYVEIDKPRSKSRGRKVFRRAERRNKPQVKRESYELIKSRHCSRSRSEDNNFCRQFKINKSSLSLSSKPDSCKGQERRRSKTRSKVKYMPLRYERRNARNLRVHVKKKPLDHQIDYKLPSESPTVIKIYPKNTDYINTLDCDASRPIITHKDLPCKCTQCIEKFKLVKNTPPKKKYQPTSNLKVHPSLLRNACTLQGNKYPHMTPYPLTSRPCEPFYPRFPCWPRPYQGGFPQCFNDQERTCISPFTVYSDYTDYEDCFTEQRLDSFSLKCNTYGQPINSAITHYFHSILNQQFSCR